MREFAQPSLRHFRLFETVARVQSVRKAAELVHLTQPAVTQAVAKLESQIGATLFDRRSSGTYLTAAGEILSARVGRMFHQIEQALAAFGAAGDTRRSLISVADRITRPHTRALTAMADGGSFSDAIRCGISKASLHRAARELERNLGKPLFCRGAAGVTITAAGAELSRKLSLAMREPEWAIEEIEAAAGKDCGEIKIGAMPLAGSFLLTPVLNEFTRSNSQVRLQVRTGDGHDVIKALRLGEVDFVVGLTRNPPEFDDIEQEPLLPLPYVLVARRDHPLARSAKITRADLEQYDWIAPTHSAARREAFDRLIATLRKPPRISIEASPLSTIRLLLGGNDRLALLTRLDFDDERGPGGLTVLQFPVIEAANPVGIIRRANWNPTPLHARFLDLIRDHATSLMRQGLRDGAAA
jgi:LysR family transcriptional regulator, regulator for genes of the gallate degradation pathway